jgi:hypothetical protein
MRTLQFSIGGTVLFNRQGLDTESTSLVTIVATINLPDTRFQYDNSSPRTYLVTIAEEFELNRPPERERADFRARVQAVSSDTSLEIANHYLVSCAQLPRVPRHKNDARSVTGRDG